MREFYGNDYLDFFYDADGRPFALNYNGTYYYYILNLQGDVIRLIDSNGITVAAYEYDPYGKIISASGSMATINPLRYRGYYYDNETGLYYLQSRYYDPQTGRFISPDSYASTGQGILGHNMFAYCNNNPVNLSDSSGNWPKMSTIFGVVAGVAVAVAAVAAVVVTCGAAAPAMAILGGGIAGGLSAGTIATAAAVGSAAVTVAKVAAVAGAISYTSEKVVKRNNSVYVLKDDNGTVQYVGRTNDVNKRRAAHSLNPDRAGLEMEIIASGLNLPEARALEQAGMAYYHTLNTTNKMNNQINSVAPKYWGAFKELALGVLDYGWNQMSNEILYWAGS